MSDLLLSPNGSLRLPAVEGISQKDAERLARRLFGDNYSPENPEWRRVVDQLSRNPRISDEERQAPPPAYKP